MKEALKGISIEKPLHIGVVKTDGIGDAVLATPFLYELRKMYPKAKITGILSPAGKEVLDNLGIFDDIRAVDPVWLKYKKVNIFKRVSAMMKMVSIINKEKFDILIGMRYHDRLSSLALSLAKSGKKYGYDVKGMGFGIDLKMKLPPEGTHVIFKNLSILKYLNKNYIPKNIKTGFSVSKDSEEHVKKILRKYSIKNFILVHPVSGHISKDWGPERYAELLKRLSRRHKIIAAGAVSDNRIGEYGGKNIYNLAGELTIKDLGSLIKRAGLVIGNDSAAVHIASVFGVKSLTLFSGTAMYEEWMAPGGKAYIITKNVSCRKCALVKCRYETHDCMDIDVDFVEKTTNLILEGKQKKNIINYT